jgi:transcription antitermination factor NusA-like protein
MNINDSTRYLTATDVNEHKYEEIANFFTCCLGKEEAVSFLETIISKINSNSKKRSLPLPCGPEEKPIEKDIEHKTNERESEVFSSDDDLLSGIYFKDIVDQTPITFAILVPNDIHMIATIIGASGANVNDINAKTNCKVQVDTQRTGSTRHIFFYGTVGNVLKAYQLVYKKMELKLGNDASLEKTIMVVPNILVSHMIGKGGKNIKPIIATTSTHMDAMTERDMYVSAEVMYGRPVTITGSFPSRVHGCYLLLRQVLYCYLSLLLC